MLPVLFLAVLLAVQLAGVLQARLMVSHAAREVGRALIIDRNIDVHSASRSAARFDPDRLAAEVSGGDESGDLVTVTLHYRTTVRVPMLGIISEPVVSTSVTVQLE